MDSFPFSHPITGLLTFAVNTYLSSLDEGSGKGSGTIHPVIGDDYIQPTADIGRIRSNREIT